MNNRKRQIYKASLVLQQHEARYKRLVDKLIQAMHVSSEFHCLKYDQSQYHKSSFSDCCNMFLSKYINLNKE